MLARLYAWCLEKAGHRHGDYWLALVSFAESSFFPIPPDLLLIPMVLARRDRWFRLALLCTVSSVVGGIVGYAIGYFLYEAVGQAIISAYHLTDKFTEFETAFRENGAMLVVLKGLTPIPYKLVTITAGVARLDLWTFILASMVSRAMRFFLVAGLLYQFGPPIQVFIEKRLTLVTSTVAVAVVLGFVAVKFL